MQDTITTLLNFDYFPLFTGFYNSIRFYGNKQRIKVLDYDRLNNFQKEYLSKFADVHTPNFNQLINKNNVGKYYKRLAYIPLNLMQSLDDYELKLDVDMLILNNLQEVFDNMHKGYYIGSAEQTNKISQLFPNHNDPNVKEEFFRKYQKHIPKNMLDNYNINDYYRLFNGGFSGLVKEKHFDLLNIAHKILEDEDIPDNNTYLLNDQTIFSLLVLLSKIDYVNKPKEEWMNLWNNHSIPRKSLFVDDNKNFQLQNINGNRVNLYHLTAGVYKDNMYKDGTHLTIRTYHSTYDYLRLTPIPFRYNEDEIKSIAWNLWKDDHKSPIMFLTDYFQNNGDFKTPMFYNIKFRKTIAEMCSLHFGGEFDIESKEVFAIAIAYDYITLLDYTITDLDWVENILLKLFKIYNVKYTKNNVNKKKIGWNNKENDVTLTFEYHPIRKHWKSFVADFTESNVEHINGLFIITKNG